MKKGGKPQKTRKAKSQNKRQKNNKHLEIEESLEFSSEGEYMSYIASKNEMENNINENFDDPFYYLMGNSDNIISR